MSVHFLGCAHMGHRNIATFRPFVDSSQANTDLIVRSWKECVHKRDVVYMMGDAAFTEEALDIISWLPGRKILIKGNHDDYVSTRAQANVFEEIYGMLKYKGMWLSHAPIHPDELRGKPNVHAHVHYATVKKTNALGFTSTDKRYFNTCVDVVFPKTGQVMVPLDTVKEYFRK